MVRPRCRLRFRLRCRDDGWAGTMPPSNHRTPFHVQSLRFPSLWAGLRCDNRGDAGVGTVAGAAVGFAAGTFASVAGDALYDMAVGRGDGTSFGGKLWNNLQLW